MIARTSLRLAAVAPVAFAAVLVTGCGSSATGTSSSSNAASQLGSSSSNNSVSSGSGGTSVLDGIGHPVNVCALLPAATAASMSGEPITVAQEQDTPSYKLWTCNYTSADGTNGFTVNVLAMDAAAGFDGDVQTNSSIGAAKYTSVSGLGDKAFASISGVEALFGNVSINVSNLNSDSASEAIIRALQPKL
jgi:Protein of unknown function (DUF3558)